MKALQEIFTSLSGAAKIRINDPFIGTFILSWTIANWNQIGLLLWGDGKPSERILALQNYLTNTDFFSFNTLFFVPFTFTIFYILIFPWISLSVKTLLKAVNDRLHQQAVHAELEQIKQQEELRKAKLLADPNKQFLEQIAQWEIDRKNEILIHIKNRGLRLKSRAEEVVFKAAAAEATASDAKIRARITQQEYQIKQQQAELEQQRFKMKSAEIRAVAATHRFPSAYFFISTIDEHLRIADIQLSLKGLSDLVAAVFGYDDFEEILEDENFTNSTFSQVKHIYYEPEHLASELESIIALEQNTNENLTSDLLYDHLIEIFENLPHPLVDIDGLKTLCTELFEESKYSLLEYKSVSGRITESDSVFDDVQYDFTKAPMLSDGFFAEVQGYSKGTYKNDSSIPGRTLTLTAKMQSKLLVGRRALSSIEIYEVDAHLEETYDFDETN